MPTARAHRIRLNPTPTQVQYFLHAAGVARLAWNETLKAYQQAKAQGEKKTDWNVLKKQFRARIDTEFPFVRTVTKCAAEQAIADLRQAIATYYKTKQTVVGTSALRKLQFPGPRRRKKRIGGFGLANDKFHVDGHTVWVPRLGAVNMAEPLRLTGKILSGRITEQAGHWYLSVTVEVEGRRLFAGSGSVGVTPVERPALADAPATVELASMKQERTRAPVCAREREQVEVSSAQHHPYPAVGIDFGLSSFATLSTGEVVETQNHFRRSERRLARLQRGLSRKQRGSKNWQKAKRRVARAHARVTHQRQDFLHKVTTRLTHLYRIICVEDLCLRGLVRTHLAKSFADAGIGEAVRQLQYKAEACGGIVQKVDRFFPSTQRCHVCGYLNHALTLKDRVWTCPCCGTQHQRDYNAAVNIEVEGTGLLAGSGFVGATPVELVPATIVRGQLHGAGNEAGTDRAHLCARER